MDLSLVQKQIIKRLAEGEFFSGRQLAEELSVSRASVWNYFKALETEGFEFHAVKGKGTRLKYPIELLDKEKIAAHLSVNKQHWLETLEVLDVCPSTNQHLAQKNSLQKAPNGSACMAEMQTLGRGRLGKTWVSPYGQNIYISFVWNFKNGISALSGLSLACGVAVCRALKTLGLQGHGLKWPNDILWQGKKMGGILVEIQGESQGGYAAIIGIGINYKMNSQASNDIDQPWVDVCQAYGEPVGRNKLAAELMREVLGVLSGYENDGLTPYVKPWNDYDCYSGKAVNIISGKTIEKGVAKGIAEHGELQLLKPNGEMKLVMSGEVSLRLSED